jgi:hypothetical protein
VTFTSARRGFYWYFYCFKTEKNMRGFFIKVLTFLHNKNQHRRSREKLLLTERKVGVKTRQGQHRAVEIQKKNRLQKSRASYNQKKMKMERVLSYFYLLFYALQTTVTAARMNPKFF